MISIIIPLKKDQGYLEKCVQACLAQEGVPFEVIVLPDQALGAYSFSGDMQVRVEATGSKGPAEKRNRGAELARGDILAFLDDDTRPHPGWLARVSAQFEDASISALGGPSLTPPDDPFLAQVSGAVYESWMMSGGERRRYLPMEPADVDDWPSCNLAVRKSVFREIGGFGTRFWPGEDTELCLALIKRGHRIFYDPGAQIYHHRRPSLKKHFRQLGNYALHRGYFVKRFPETSRKPQYFAPTLFVVGLALLMASGLMGLAWITLPLLILLLGTYAVIAFISIPGNHPFKVRVMGVVTIFLSHLTYGILFVKGLLAGKLPEEKSR
jgi:GT2 family glycosyltransferase